MATRRRGKQEKTTDQVENNKAEETKETEEKDEKKQTEKKTTRKRTAKKDSSAKKEKKEDVVETAKKDDKNQEAEKPLIPQESRKLFLEALSFIKPGIASGSIIDQSDMVLMDGDRIVSYDDEVAISHPYPIGHRGGVYFNELQKLLQKLPIDKIEIAEANEDGQDQLIIYCKKTEATFYVVKDISIPELGIEDVEEWHELPSDFIQALEFCVSSASADSSLGLLSCINITQEEIMSCDNYRAARFTFKDGFDCEVQLNVPRTAAKEIAKYKPVEVGNDDSWIHFRNESGTTFSCRTISGEYPNVKGLFEKGDGNKIELPKELKKTLDRVEVLAGESEATKAKIVFVEIGDGEILCTGQGQSGKITESVTTAFKGSVPKFAVDPSILGQILDVAQEAIMGERRLLFEGERFSYAVCLLAEE